MTEKETLLREIEMFLVATGMSATAFGHRAMNDRHFVHQLRGNRHCWPKTVKKARDWMDAHPAAEAKGAA